MLLLKLELAKILGRWYTYDMSEQGVSLEDLERAERAEEEVLVNGLGQIFKEKIAANKGSFQETLPIKPDGTLEVMDAQNELKSFFAHLGQSGTEALYKLAYSVQKKFPELAFKFERDTNGKSISYVVSEGSLSSNPQAK